MRTEEEVGNGILDRETRAFLEGLSQITFFTNVGRDGACVNSWAEAIVRDNDDWSNVQLDAANKIREDIQKASQVELNRWNTVVHVVRPNVLDIVNRLASKNESAVWKPVLATVRWDLLHAVCEHHFRQYHAVMFYRELVRCYAAGRFPCGWHGDFESGRPLAF